MNSLVVSQVQSVSVLLLVAQFEFVVNPLVVRQVQWIELSWRQVKVIIGGKYQVSVSLLLGGEAPFLVLKT